MSKDVCKFKVGDKVRIVNYGSTMWIGKKEKQPTHWPVIEEQENIIIYDTDSELIGQTGIVTKTQITQGQDRYELHGPNKVAWYFNNQLELV